MKVFVLVSLILFSGFTLVAEGTPKTHYRVTCTDGATLDVYPGHVLSVADLKLSEDRTCKESNHKGIKSLEKIS